jgi:acetolactate synthase-1/3 small subunit
MISAPLKVAPARGWRTGASLRVTAGWDMAETTEKRAAGRSDYQFGRPVQYASDRMRHIIAIHLQNEAGALTRVAGLFSTRGYNIESLSVAATEDPTVSRITLVTQGSDAVIQQIVSQLNKLIDVVSVEDMTQGEHIERELVLLKLKVRPEQSDAVRGYVVRSGGRVLDPASEGFVVELTASEADVDKFVADLARGAQLLEVVRSGALGISRLERAARSRRD